MRQQVPLDSVVVVGASLAGHATAHALRAEGYAGRITMVGEETHRPYDRPPLSKGFLAGHVSVEDLSLEDPSTDLGLDWRLGQRAVALDPASHTVTLADGSTVCGDAVVVATGARARTLPGPVPAGVHTLRTLDDARALRAELVPGARLVLVGAGFVGSEVASTARGLGVEVTLVEAAPTPLAGPLGIEVGALVAGLHAAHGVPLLSGTPVAGLAGDERVTGVHLADGRTLAADVVVVGIGSLPHVEWLDGSGLARADGLLCDATGGTAAPGVFGVGDCSSWYDVVLGRHHRVEHWTDALQRSRTVVAALLGLEPPPVAAPYFWSEQYDVCLQFAGHRTGDETVTVEAGSAETLDLLVTYRRADGVPTAVLGLGQPRLFGRLRRALGRSPVAA